MGNETIIFTLAHKSAEVMVSLEYSGADDEGITLFQHPRTGQDCEHVKGILEGCRERDPEAQAEWEELATLAKGFCDDGELYWKVENGGRYEL